jgi:Na+/proline symporter
MHIIAATFLLPIGVILYTFVGGIKATFLTDYFHTFVITIIICFFTIKIFTLDEIGSPSDLFNLVVEAGKRHPVVGNKDGSYLTMESKDVGLSSPLPVPVYIEN